MQAKLTDLIHPEAVFMLHGFGHRLPVESRAFGKGLAERSSGELGQFRGILERAATDYHVSRSSM